MLTKTLINQSQHQTSLFVMNGVASNRLVTTQVKTSLGKSANTLKSRAMNPAMSSKSSNQQRSTVVMQAVAEPPATRAEPGTGGAGTLQPPGILDNLFPPGAQDVDSIWDKVTDPFGKQKEEKRKEQKKKIDELYGKGTASSIAAPL